VTVRLFLHSPSEAPDAATVVGRMPEFEHLSERALLLAGRGDVVCLARAVDDLYLDYLEALELGPRREDIVVVDGVRPGRGLAACLIRDPGAMDRVVRRLSRAGSIVVSPFFPTASAFAVGRAIEERLGGDVRVEGGSAELAMELHDKIAARALAVSLGLPVAPGEIVRLERAGPGRARDTGALRDAIERRSGITGHVIVRGASGASGSSTFTSRSASGDAMIDAIAERTDNALYLVEPLFEARFSPNVEVLVEPHLPALVGTSEQVLDRNLIYVGSVHPSPARRLPRMVEDAHAIVAWMRQRGFSGRVGFDFVEHAGTGGDLAHFLTEINPRINGASYPLALLRRLTALADRRRSPAPVAFRTGWVSVRTNEYAELARLSRSLLYDPARGEGIVPYSVGALPVGSVGIACFGRTPEAVDGLQEEFVHVAGDLAYRAASADAA
jgi:hypothetical protein